MLKPSSLNLLVLNKVKSYQGYTLMAVYFNFFIGKLDWGLLEQTG